MYIAVLATTMHGDNCTENIPSDACCPSEWEIQDFECLVMELMEVVRGLLTLFVQLKLYLLYSTRIVTSKCNIWYGHENAKANHAYRYEHPSSELAL